MNDEQRHQEIEALVRRGMKKMAWTLLICVVIVTTVFIVTMWAVPRANGQSPDDDARAALALAQASKKEQPKPKIVEPTYDELVYASAYKQSLDLKRPLVIFVGVKERGITGAVCCGMEECNGSSDARVLVVRPWSNMKASLLPSDATDAAISREVSQSAVPFAPSRSGKRRGEVIADTDVNLPQLRDLLAGMEQYQSTDRTQTTFRRWSGYITPSSRLELPNKWIVPGHLDGIEGWSSTLYRTKGVRAKEFLVRQDPSDGSSAVTWDRSYPDGTSFVDVLRNADGKVFEVRMAEKADGTWDRFVKFRDATTRPHDYIRPTTEQCAACHNQAGRSEYGGAAIAGGDTIISDGFYALEHGGSVQGGYGTSLR